MATSRFEEIKLLALCMATDNREAFSRLVEMHQQSLRRFLLNLTGGDEALTDDLAQETFIKAWLAIRSFHGLSGFRTWLFRIAVNEFSTSRRRISRMATASEDISQLHIEDTGSSPAGHDIRMDVRKVVDRLPEKQKLVTLLFYMEELPVKEIVKITGMPDGTVKSHLSRARASLARLLNDEPLKL